jgi:uncharacterized protein
MAEISVQLVYSPAPRLVHEMTLSLTAASRVSDALAQAAAQDERFANVPINVSYGIWNRSAQLDQSLAEGDRLEIYRPLRVDPKVARRERFKKQGAKSAGLFAQRRPGAKAGY